MKKTKGNIIPVIFLVSLFYFPQGSIKAQERLAPEQEEVQQVVRYLFDALGENDLEKIQHHLTRDVRILEHGVIWTMDTIISFSKRVRPEDFKRINRLDFFQTEVSDNMAFVSYNNQAHIVANKKEFMAKWLESAVLIKEDAAWKVKLLHSTRLE